MIFTVNLYKHPSFAMKYPSCHSKQRRIADGFKRSSRASWGVCAGAVDGILIWIEKPFENQPALKSLGQAKFYCGCKNKYGLSV